MIVVWRGYGYLALAAAVLPWALFAVGIVATESHRPDPSPGFGRVTLGLGFVGVGYACRRANATGNRHTLYFVAVQHWVPIYGAFGVLAGVGGGVSLIAPLVRGR